jgi:succinate dehydrogenase / fumarate reductase cytochrome b subunit
MSTCISSYLQTSIIKKQIMAITGLMLCGFLVTHLAGNTLIFVGAEAFNTYAHTLISNPLIEVAECILAAIFLTHIGFAIKVTIENNNARPKSYYMKKTSGKGATFASSTMPYSGTIILVFLIFHLLKLKYGAHYDVTYDGVVMRDLYRLLIEYFSSPLNVIWYLFSMVCLGIHLSHGFWSAFQSLGFNHQKYNKALKCTSFIYALAVSSAYSSMPIYCYIQGMK